MRRRRPRYSGFERADGLLTIAMRKRRLLGQLSEGKALGLWRDAVGPDVARQTHAESCRKGLLTVVTGDSIQSHQLQSRSRDIIEKLNRLAGEEAVRRIRFRVASVPCGAETPNQAQQPSVSVSDEELGARRLTATEEAEIEGLVSLIENAEIRERTRTSMEIHYRADGVLRDRGWRPCEGCRALMPPDRSEELCTVCGHGKRESGGDRRHEEHDTTD